MTGIERSASVGRSQRGDDTMRKKYEDARPGLVELRAAHNSLVRAFDGPGNDAEHEAAVQLADCLEAFYADLEALLTIAASVIDDKGDPEQKKLVKAMRDTCAVLGLPTLFKSED